MYRVRHLDESGPQTASLSGAIVAGFVASTVMLFVFTIAYAVAWLLGGALPGDVPLLGTLRQWFAGLTQNALIDLARPNLYAAAAVYFVGGLLWAALYAYVFHPRLGGPEWRRGMLFSLVPWLFSLAVFLPLVGGGFFGFTLGAGPLPIIGNLILHLVYGATLAEVYGPLGDVIDAEAPAGADQRTDVWANEGSRSGTAKGLLMGLLAGAVVGVAATGPTLAAGAPAAGMHPAATLLAAVFIGGALGALIGSLAGLSVPESRT